MQLNGRKLLKLGLTVVGAILVGALGSGLWDAVLRPVFRALSYGILDLASFGWQSYRSGVYREIAEKSPTTNLDTLYCVGLLVSMIVFAMLLTLFNVRPRIRPVKPETEAERNESSKKIIRRWVLRPFFHPVPFYLYIAFLVVLITMPMVMFARNSYVTRAISHYEQDLRIAAPYVDVGRREIIESQFSQIQDRKGYTDVVGQLEKVAREHGQFVPEFKPW